MRLTPPARSIAEYSRHASVDSSLRACAPADRLRGELNHSDDERRARALLRAHGALGQVPHRPMPALDERGVPIAEIDIPFFDVRYGWRSTDLRTAGRGSRGRSGA